MLCLISAQAENHSSLSPVRIWVRTNVLQCIGIASLLHNRCRLSPLDYITSFIHILLNLAVQLDRLLLSPKLCTSILKSSNLYHFQTFLMLYDQLKVKEGGAKGRGVLVMRFACPLKPQKKTMKKKRL